MERTTRLLEIIKDLNDNRSKLSALFSLYNSSLLVAEDNRLNMSAYYEQMIDLRNDITAISNEIFAAKKADRDVVYSRNKLKIKHLDSEVQHTNKEFKQTCEKYRIALQECGSLKTEYKQEVSRLTKEFKALAAEEEIEPIVIKGYKQQVRIIKAIFEKIEQLISDYNVKRNRIEQDDERFADLYYSVNELITRLQDIA